MSIAEERPLRADARRNRDAILKAAKSVLARDGTDAQMDDIARRAKVGVGTVYRHFPTKEALVGALMADRFEQIAAFAEEALQDPDPFRGFVTSLWRGAELGAKDRAITGIFGERTNALMKARQCSERLNAAAAELIARAQAAGTMRADVTVDDVPVFMCGLMQAMHQPGQDPDAWRRHLQIVIDGLRAGPHTTPLGSPVRERAGRHRP
jgi:AcrR family transcriptional regulator